MVRKILLSGVIFVCLVLSGCGNTGWIRPAVLGVQGTQIIETTGGNLYRYKADSEKYAVLKATLEQNINGWKEVESNSLNANSSGYLWVKNDVTEGIEVRTRKPAANFKIVNGVKFGKRNGRCFQKTMPEGKSSLKNGMTMTYSVVENGVRKEYRLVIREE